MNTEISESIKRSAQGVLQEYFSDQPGAYSSAMSEVEDFLRFPARAAAIKKATGVFQPTEAIITWAKKQGEVWRFLCSQTSR